jgi:hypothetical protein
MSATRTANWEHFRFIRDGTAILSLTLHDGRRVWKSVDWAITDRLYDKGLIENPAGKSKSLVLTDKGLAEAKAMLTEMFGKT